MVAVEDLVAREASGVLEVTGNPSGAIYLDSGRIAFARASWVPGLAARLRSTCPGLAGEPLPSAGDADDAAIAGIAVRRGYLTPGGLHELIGSIVADAFLVLTIPVAYDSSVDAIRFTSTRTYWTEVFPRFGLEQVRAEALRRAERMAQLGLAPTTEVTLRDLRAPAAVLTSEQWAVASQIGAHAAAWEVAARRGAALTDTMDCLGQLAEAGLCAPVRIPRRGQPRRPSVRVVPAAPPVTPAAPGPPPPPPVVPVTVVTTPVATVRNVPAPAAPGSPAPGAADRLPSRHTGQRQVAQDHFAHATAAVQAPSVDLLRQVLAGLRKLA
jgi:hypothetical protein